MDTGFQEVHFLYINDELQGELYDGILDRYGAIDYVSGLVVDDDFIKNYHSDEIKLSTEWYTLKNEGLLEEKHIDETTLISWMKDGEFEKKCHLNGFECIYNDNYVEYVDISKIRESMEEKIC